MDEAKLGLARQAAAKSGLSNAEFRVLDVGDWDEPGGYDAVYSRFLLQHLSQPAWDLDSPHVGGGPGRRGPGRGGRRLRRVVLRSSELSASSCSWTPTGGCWPAAAGTMRSGGSCTATC